MRNKRKFIGIILNMFDGSDAGGSGGEGDGGTTSAGGIKPEAMARGKELGVDDDLMADYQRAYFGDSGNDAGTGEQTESTDNRETVESEDLNAEFEKLVNGKYKDAYKSYTSELFKDRLSRANKDKAELESRAAKNDRVMKLLSEKYGSADPDALYNAIRGDNDMWRQQAIDNGQTTEEFFESYDQKQTAAAQQQELEALRQYKQANELNARLQGLAKDTREQYPDFDLEREFENPKFRAALDYAAAQNEERNRQSGQSGEIFDLTFAYELAHADEIRANQIKRVSKATASAVAQTMQANRQRPAENAARRGAQTKTRSYSDMSDEEFGRYLEKVRRGEARI